MKRRLYVLLFVAFALALGTPAQAAKKHKSKKKPVAVVKKEEEEPPQKLVDSVLTPEQPDTIDKLQEKMYRLRKSKKARTLKKAYDALQELKYAKARGLAQAVVNDETFGDYGRWIVESALRKEAEKAFESKQYDTAQSSAQRAVSLALEIEAKDPYSPLARNVPKDAGMAELTLGSVQWARKKWSRAEDFFDRGLQRLSTIGTFEEVRPEMLQRIAETCAKHKSDMCLSWVQRFVSLYPRNAVEMKAMARALPEVLDRARAPKPLSKITQTYKTQEMDQIAFDAAMGLYLDGKYGDAIDGLGKFLNDFPKSAYRFRARYWLAQANIQRQDHDKAEKQLEDLEKDSPLTYYGLLASISTAKGIEGNINTAKPIAAETDPFLLPTEVRRLRRAQNFIVEGAYELASIELRDVKPRDALSNHFLMYLAMLCNEAKNYNTSFQILQQLAQRGYDGMETTYVLGMIFPTPYFDLVRKHASRNELDPILVLSLIKQESAFTPNIGSGAGAVGLMQLMPTTAVDVDPDITRADLLEPDTNIRTGTKYLKWLLTKFNGNIVAALAGYNAGPYAADRWLRANPEKRGMLEFIESIPYKETRDYVSAIVRNYYWYSRRLTSDVPKSMAYFWNMYGPPALQRVQANDPIAPIAPGPDARIFEPGKKPPGPDVDLGPGGAAPNNTDSDVVE